MRANASLHRAKAEKNDEFYTQLTDIIAELGHYEGHFQGKSVLCNCDDPSRSAFWEYFHLNFERLGLKKLTSTHYDKTGQTYRMEYEGGDDDDIGHGTKTALKEDGDFRSQECLDILDACDIVVTNPPFSLAREYLNVLMEHGKRFIIIGDLNWATYKEVFPLLKNDAIWLGHNPVKEFVQPDGGAKKFGNKLWFTNLDTVKRHERLDLCKRYTPEEYSKYDNYDAINVDRVSDIPMDYDGVMGVPITFLDRYCPEQFEIVEFSRYLEHDGMSREFVDEYRRQGNKGHVHEGHPDLCYYDRDGKAIVPYMRILIRRIG